MTATNHPGTDNRARVKALKAEGKKVSEIVEITGLAKPTVYAYLRPEGKSAKTKAKTATKVANGHAPASITLTPTKSGSFLLEVPPDRVASVMQAIAAQA